MNKFEKQLENESELSIDLTILSFDEERQVEFLGRVSAIQLKWILNSWGAEQDLKLAEKLLKVAESCWK